MKILCISHEASATGAPIFFYELIKWLKSNLKDLVVDIVLVKEGEIKELFGSLGDLTSLAGKSNDEIRKVLSILLEKNTYDIFYYNTLETAHILEIISSLGVNGPHLFHIHELEGIIQRYGGSEKIQVINDLASSIVTVSQPVFDNLVENHSFDSDKMDIIPPFVRNIQEWDSEQISNWKIENKSSDKKIILACGDIGVRKGTDFFINLAKSFKNNNDNLSKNLRFMWVGPDSNKVRSFFEKEIELSGLEGFLGFEGYTDDVTPYFNCCDIFFMCSREDPHPLVCLEAVRLKKPVLYFPDAGGISTFFGDDSGYPIAYLDVETARKQIIELLENPEASYQNIDNGLKRLQEKYSVEVVGKKILKKIIN